MELEEKPLDKLKLKHQGLLYLPSRKLLSKLPMPAKKGLAEVKITSPSAVSEEFQKAEWNMEIDIRGDILHIGNGVTLGKKYFIQTAAIPLAGKEKAVITLYLDCFSCSEESLNGIS